MALSKNQMNGFGYYLYINTWRFGNNFGKFWISIGDGKEFIV
jgi:hypothetical protein